MQGPVAVNDVGYVIQQKHCVGVTDASLPYSLVLTDITFTSINNKISPPAIYILSKALYAIAICDVLRDINECIHNVPIVLISINAKVTFTSKNDNILQ